MGAEPRQKQQQRKQNRNDEQMDPQLLQRSALLLVPGRLQHADRGVHADRNRRQLPQRARRHAQQGHDPITVVLEYVVAPPEIPLARAATVVVDGLLGILVSGPRIGFHGPPANRLAADESRPEPKRGHRLLVLVDDVIVVENVDHPPAGGIAIPDLVEDVAMPTEAVEGKCP